MRHRASIGSVLVLALSGLVHADVRLPHRDRASELGQPSPTEQALTSLAKEEHSLRAELEELAAQEVAAERRLVSRGRAVYRMLRLGLLPAGGGFNSLLDHALKMERARRALDKDVSDYRAIGDRKIAIARKLDELSTRRAPLELAQAEAAQARALSTDAEDRKHSFERAFENSTGAGDYVAIYGGVLGAQQGGALGARPGSEEPSGSSADGLRAMKGRLPFPIAGRAEIRAVRRPGASGPGLEMAAPMGTAVRAVFAGRVAFADRYDPFGQIVILDHGNRFYTLMGDLATIDVRVGDDLSAGAKVGTVGKSTRAASPALYFELRHGSTTLEPGPWLGL